MTVLKRIILIDDDPDDQLFFRDALQVVCPGLHCELASTCQEAFRQLGASWYMIKPDDFKVLCKKLNEIIRQESLEGLYII